MRAVAVHDQMGAAYYTLRLLHIVGSMLLTGALALMLVMKVGADRSGDPARAAGVHRAFQRGDVSVLALGGVLTFVGGYSMVRFLGGRIAQHWFAVWGLILLFVALGFWYFGTRRLNKRLAEEAESCVAGRQPLGHAYAKASVAWLACTVAAFAAMIVAAFVMVFRAQLGIA